jgi:hypothetical protein
VLDGFTEWMNIIPSEDIQGALVEVHASETVMKKLQDKLSRNDARVLDHDLTRTFDAFKTEFPGCDSAENRQTLRRVLLCAVTKANCGYCQGLNFVAAAILLGAGPELEPTIQALHIDETKRASIRARFSPALAVCVLFRLLTFHGLAAMYMDGSRLGVESALEDGTLPPIDLEADSGTNQATASRSPLQVLSYVFCKMLKQHAPRVLHHLLDSGMPPELLAVRWFTTCFSRAIPVEGVLMAVDAVMAGVPNVFLRLATGILLSLEEVILRMPSDELLMKLGDVVHSVSLEDVWSRTLQLPPSIVEEDSVGTKRASWESRMYRHHVMRGEMESKADPAWVTIKTPKPHADGSSAAAAEEEEGATTSATPGGTGRAVKPSALWRKALLGASAVVRFRATFRSQDIALIMRLAEGEAVEILASIKLASSIQDVHRGLVMDILIALHANTMPLPESTTFHWVGPHGPPTPPMHTPVPAASSSVPDDASLPPDTDEPVTEPNAVAATAGPTTPKTETSTTPVTAEEDPATPYSLRGMIVRTLPSGARDTRSWDERRAEATSAGCAKWAMDAVDTSTWKVPVANDGAWLRWAQVALVEIEVDAGVAWFHLTVRVPDALYETTCRHRFSQFDTLLSTLGDSHLIEDLSKVLSAMGLAWPHPPDPPAPEDVLSITPISDEDGVPVTYTNTPGSPSKMDRTASFSTMTASASFRSPDAKPSSASISVAASSATDLHAPSLPPLPPKTWFGVNAMNRAFMRKRGSQVCVFAQRILDMPFLAKHPHVSQFFDLDWAAILARASLPKQVRADLAAWPDWCWDEDSSDMQVCIQHLKDDKALHIDAVSAGIRLLQHRMEACMAKPPKPRSPTKPRAFKLGSKSSSRSLTHDDTEAVVVSDVVHPALEVPSQAGSGTSSTPPPLTTQEVNPAASARGIRTSIA